MSSLAIVFPCQRCGEHLFEHINAIPFTQIVNNDIFTWTYLLHHRVNLELQKREVLTCEAWRRVYATMPVSDDDFWTCMIEIAKGASRAQLSERIQTTCTAFQCYVNTALLLYQNTSEVRNILVNCKFEQYNNAYVWVLMLRQFITAIPHNARGINPFDDNKHPRINCAACFTPPTSYT